MSLQIPVDLLSLQKIAYLKGSESKIAEPKNASQLEVQLERNHVKAPGSPKQPGWESEASSMPGSQAKLESKLEENAVSKDSSSTDSESQAKLEANPAQPKPLSTSKSAEDIRLSDSDSKDITGHVELDLDDHVVVDASDKSGSPSKLVEETSDFKSRSTTTTNYTDDEDQYGVLKLLPPEATKLFRLVEVNNADGTLFFTARTGTQCEKSQYIYLFTVQMTATRNCCDQNGTANLNKHQHHDPIFDNATAYVNYYVLDEDLRSFLAMPGKVKLVINAISYRYVIDYYAFDGYS